MGKLKGKRLRKHETIHSPQMGKNKWLVLVYNNTMTHLKRLDGALSARKMPKFTSKPESNWLVEVNAVDANGKVIYTPDGKILKTKIQMQDATFADGTKQSLYFPAGHEKEGLFKGMAVRLGMEG